MRQPRGTTRAAQSGEKVIPAHVIRTHTSQPALSFKAGIFVFAEDLNSQPQDVHLCMVVHLYEFYRSPGARHSSDVPDKEYDRCIETLTKERRNLAAYPRDWDHSVGWGPTTRQQSRRFLLNQWRRQLLMEAHNDSYRAHGNP